MNMRRKKVYHAEINLRILATDKEEAAGLLRSAALFAEYYTSYRNVAISSCYLVKETHVPHRDPKS